MDSCPVFKGFAGLAMAIGSPSAHHRLHIFSTSISFGLPGRDLRHLNRPNLLTPFRQGPIRSFGDHISLTRDSGESQCIASDAHPVPSPPIFYIRFHRSSLTYRDIVFVELLALPFSPPLSS